MARKRSGTYHQNPSGDWVPCMTEDGKPCRIHSGSEHIVAMNDTELKAELERREAVSNKYNAINKLSRKTESIKEMANDQQIILQNAVMSKTTIANVDLGRRKEYVERVNNLAISRGLTTNNMYAQNKNGITKYNEDRLKLHKDIINHFLSNAKTDNVKHEGRALFTGGLGGSGKSTVLKRAGYHEEEYLTINNDDIKEELARRGMIPKIKGLTPMEACPLVHEEASDIMKQLFRKAANQKINIIIDGTMSSVDSVKKKTDMLRDSGYSEIKAVFVDIDPDTSLERAEHRYASGMNRYTTMGDGNGGRWLPKSVVDNNRSSNPAFRSTNASTLVELQQMGVFTSTPEVWDNNVKDREPVRVNYEDFSGESIDDIIKWPE